MYITNNMGRQCMYIPPLLCMLHLYNILNYKYLICFANRQIPIYNGQFNQKAPPRYLFVQSRAYLSARLSIFWCMIKQKDKGGYHEHQC